MVFPQPAPPAINTDDPSKNPPCRMSSRPGIPVGTRFIGKTFKFADLITIYGAEVFKDLGAMDVHDQLVGIVDYPDWKTMLVDIVKAKDMDPWNIDVTALSSMYLEKIRSMQKVDFRVPANAVLCSSILIRFKSDSWELYPQDEFEDQLEEDSNWEYIIEGKRVPELDPARRIVRRRITIDDLIHAVEKVMDKERKRAMRERQRLEVPQELINIAMEDREDFEELVETIYQRVLANADSEKMALFSQVVPSKTRMDTIFTLLPLLHLATRGKLGLSQDESFGEIFIFLAEDGNGKEVSGGSGAVHEQRAADN